MLLKFYGPGMCRNRPDVGNIFMQCLLHLLRRYFVPLPWQFLTQPELQQGSDRLNCSQKHVLMWYGIKINYINNEQVASIFSCSSALRFGAGVTFRPSIFRHSRQAKSVFGGPKFRAGDPKFRVGGPKFRAVGAKFCISSKFWLVHLGDDPGWRCPRCLP